MPKQSKDFYPPTPNNLIIWMMYHLVPHVLDRMCGVAKITVPDDDLRRLRESTLGRCIITPNHPSRVEPVIAVYLASLIHRRFHYVSAIENFEGIWERTLQCIGAYSITRGTSDRKSLSTTRSLIAEQDQQVVIFPEGEIYHHNDFLLPLNAGVAQIGFWALQDLAKLGKPLSLPVVPIAVKYKFLDDVSGYIHKRVARLEKALGIIKPEGNLRDRVLQVGATIVQTLEKRYKLPHDGDLSTRIERIRCCIIDRGLTMMSVDPKIKEQGMAEQMRALFNAVREFKADSHQANTEYEQRIASQTMVQVQLVIDDLNRVSDSIMTSGQYVTGLPTYERLGDLLGRMEDEVFGKHVRYPKREAIVRIAEPLELASMAEAYKENKRATVSSATAQIASKIAGMLDELASEGNLIPESEWPRINTVESSVI
jgi:hypothetical protein